MINDTGYGEFQEENIPDGELALYPGMHIKSKDDDKVGMLDELVLDSESGDITHLLMREGHLWGEKDVAIPVYEVEFCDAVTIYLKLYKAAVKTLPAVKIKETSSTNSSESIAIYGAEPKVDHLPDPQLSA